MLVADVGQLSICFAISNYPSVRPHSLRAGLQLFFTLKGVAAKIDTVFGSRALLGSMTCALQWTNPDASLQVLNAELFGSVIVRRAILLAFVLDALPMFCWIRKITRRNDGSSRIRSLTQLELHVSKKSMISAHCACPRPLLFLLHLFLHSLPLPLL